MSCNYCGNEYELCERDDSFICEGCYDNCPCDDCDETDGCTIFRIKNEFRINKPLHELAKSIMAHILYSKGMMNQKLDSIEELCRKVLGDDYE